MTTITLNKKLGLSLASFGLILGLTACGGGDTTTSTNTNTTTGGDTTADAGVTADAGASSQEGSIKMGVVGAVYEELWAPAQAALAEDGIILEFVQFSDYVTPNNALAHGEIDLNAFQHRIYLADEVEIHGYEIENVGDTIILPLNMYSEKVTSLDELQDGDLVAIPDDLTNGGRALKVLEGAGLISLDPAAEFNPTVDDVLEYHVGIEIQELKANTIPSALPDLAAGIINGNFAMDFGLGEDQTIFYDSSLEEELYWCLVAARSEDAADPETKEIYDAVMDAFQSQGTLDVFEESFDGYFLPAGWEDKVGN